MRIISSLLSFLIHWSRLLIWSYFHVTFATMALIWNQQVASSEASEVMPPALLFLLWLDLDIQRVFCVFICNNYLSIFLKSVIGILVETAWNLYFTLAITAIFWKIILLRYNYGRSFWSVLFLSLVFWAIYCREPSPH